MKLNILIVEDEPFVAQRLKRLLNNILVDHADTIHHSNDLSGAKNILTTQAIDLIMLDLNLAGDDGFDLLKQFTAEAAHTIVVSAETGRALKAFEYGVLDFVPKPFTQDRLEKALARLKEKPETFGDHPPTKHLAFEARSGVEIIDVDDIQFFKGADKYSEAILTTGDVKFHAKPLNRLQHILSSSFLRTHKSYLVRREAINAVRSLEGSRYVLDLISGESLPIGRTRIEHVRQFLGRQNA